MSILSPFRTPDPPPPPPAASLPVDTVTEGLRDWAPPPPARLALPPLEGLTPRTAVPTIDQQIATLTHELRTAAAVVAEQRRVTAAERAEAEDALVKVKASARFGEATPDAVEAARDRLAAASEAYADAQRDPRRDLEQQLANRLYERDRERIAMNRPTQLLALPRLATAYALELQVEQQLTTVKAHRLALERATKSVSFHHANPLDTPIRERADAIVARTYDRVLDALGLTPPPNVVHVRHSPKLPQVRADERAILDAHRQAKR